MDTPQILLIEDDLSSQAIVRAALSQYKTTVAGTLGEARHYLAKGPFDLILLDVNLPDGDGFNFLMELNNVAATQGIPVILLTGKTEDTDKVTGYSLGADDYITKPINPLVFRAAIAAKLQKYSKQKAQSPHLALAGFEIDLAKQSIVFSESGKIQALDLTPLEFKLFLHFFKNLDQVFSRDQLIDLVWGDSININDRTVDSHISRLRKMINPSTLTIKSVYGSGYKLTYKDEHERAV